MAEQRFQLDQFQEFTREQSTRIMTACAQLRMAAETIEEAAPFAEGGQRVLAEIAKLESGAAEALQAVQTLQTLAGMSLSWARIQQLMAPMPSPLKPSRVPAEFATGDWVSPERTPVQGDVEAENIHYHGEPSIGGGQ